MNELTMLQLAYPWLLILLLVPILVRWFSRPHQESRVALSVPFLDRLSRLTGREPASGAVIPCGSWLQRAVLVLVWCSLVLALARPQHVGEPITKTLPGRDLLIAVDLSGAI